ERICFIFLSNHRYKLALSSNNLNDIPQNRRFRRCKICSNAPFVDLTPLNFASPRATVSVPFRRTTCMNPRMKQPACVPATSFSKARQVSRRASRSFISIFLINCRKNTSGRANMS
ncbi:hypothetical protein PENTCL1PPCAC_3865, partial [Pristionchus entomophagus]